MLVLTRRPGERIILSGDGRTVVTIVEVRGEAVRLGFDAPLDVAIDREEIFGKKHAEQLEDLEDQEGKDTDIDE